MPGMLHSSFAVEKIVPDAAGTYYQTEGGFLAQVCRTAASVEPSRLSDVSKLYEVFPVELVGAGRTK